jgi:hypothetical protein
MDAWSSDEDPLLHGMLSLGHARAIRRVAEEEAASDARLPFEIWLGLQQEVVEAIPEEYFLEPGEVAIGHRLVEIQEEVPDEEEEEGPDDIDELL